MTDETNQQPDQANNEQSTEETVATPKPVVSEETAAPTPPTQEAAPATDGSDAGNADQSHDDDSHSDVVTKPAPVVETPKAAEPVADTAVLAPVPEAPVVATLSALDPQDGDDEQVASLKIQLAEFKKSVMRPGKRPEDFRGAAKLAVQITKHVIQYPKVPVLNTLLAFFEENLDGACSYVNYHKGSQTTSFSDQQQVGYLYALFSDLANKVVVRVNNAQVVNILKKQEIADFFNRRVAVLKQARTSEE